MSVISTTETSTTQTDQPAQPSKCPNCDSMEAMARQYKISLRQAYQRGYTAGMTASSDYREARDKGYRVGHAAGLQTAHDEHWRLGYLSGHYAAADEVRTAARAATAAAVIEILWDYHWQVARVHLEAGKLAPGWRMKRDGSWRQEQEDERSLRVERAIRSTEGLAVAGRTYHEAVVTARDQYNATEEAARRAYQTVVEAYDEAERAKAAAAERLIMKSDTPKSVLQR